MLFIIHQMLHRPEQLPIHQSTSIIAAPNTTGHHVVPHAGPSTVQHTSLKLTCFYPILVTLMTSSRHR